MEAVSASQSAGADLETRPEGLDHLRALEAEAVHTTREVVAELERPVLLFSGGKDSIVPLRLAEKAFGVVGFSSFVTGELLTQDTS